MSGFLIELIVDIVGDLVFDAIRAKRDDRSGNKTKKVTKARLPSQDKLWQCVCGQGNSENLSYCTCCRRDRSEGERHIQP